MAVAHLNTLEFKANSPLFHANRLGVVPQVSSITSYIALASPQDICG